jgi:hypothetical protein
MYDIMKNFNSKYYKTSSIGNFYYKKKYSILTACMPL